MNAKRTGEPVRCGMCCGDLTGHTIVTRRERHIYHGQPFETVSTLCERCDEETRR